VKRDEEGIACWEKELNTEYEIRAGGIMTKIVVTGGAGFIGSHLVDRLVRDGAGEIAILDNLFRGKVENIAHHWANPAVSFCQLDIRDEAAVRTAVAGAEVVYHLAAQSNVMGALGDIDYSFGTNVVGTFNVLKAARDGGVRRVVFSSSREVYGEAQYLPVDENHPLNAKNSYGGSKAAGEFYCRVFVNDFGLETAVLRLANVYGPRDFGRVIPLWLGRAAAGADLIVYGGKQIIDFVWVDLVVEALVRAATAEVVGIPINVGSGQGTPILELAERILALSGSAARLDHQPARSVEVVAFTADIGRMQGLLGLEAAGDPLGYLPLMVGEG
jgi:UDP-glucose 4-epimerase